MLSSGPEPVRLLLLSDGRSAQSEAQFDPIFRNKRKLRNQLGLVVEHRPLVVGQLPPRRLLARYNIIGFKLDYRTSRQDVLRVAEYLAQSKPAGCSLIYCDGNDELTIQWPGLLPRCDLYWKKHTFRDLTSYLRQYRGTTNLVEYALGEKAAENLDQLPLTECDLRKIFRGPSIGLDQKIAALAPLLAENVFLARASERPNDVVLRADIPDNWMGRLRRPAAEILQKMQGRRKILLPQGRVPQKQYQQEMIASKICVSPFGYGEICWRDFEAVAYGCLLFKPSMDHVDSQPDIFQALRTYVPVKWDFSDLENKIDHYLARPEESALMVERARQVLRESLEPQWFVEIARELLAQSALATQIRMVQSRLSEAPGSLIQPAHEADEK